MGKNKTARVLLLSVVAAAVALVALATNALADTSGPGVTAVACGVRTT